MAKHRQLPHRVADLIDYSGAIFVPLSAIFADRRRSYRMRKGIIIRLTVRPNGCIYQVYTGEKPVYTEAGNIHFSQLFKKPESYQADRLNDCAKYYQRYGYTVEIV